MILYPAIDLKDGKCVRLLKGDMAAATVYHEDAAAQALEFRLPLKAAVRVEAARARVREFVAPLREDRVLAGDITKLAGAIRDGAFDEWLG